MIISKTNKEKLILFFIYIIMFFLPFGSWQEKCLKGMTFAKLFMPVIFILFFLFFYKNIKIPKIAILILTFIVAIIPSFIIGNNFFFFPIFLNFLGYCFLSIILYNSISSLYQLENMLKYYYIGLLFISILCLFSILGFFDLGKYMGQPLMYEKFAPRITGTENNPNGFATFFILGIPIALHYLYSKQSIFIKLFHFIVLLLFFYLIFLTSARAAFIATIFASFTYLYINSQSIGFKIIIIVIFPLTIILSLSLPKLISDYNIKLTSKHSETKLIDDAELMRDKKLAENIRLKTAEISLNIIKNNPIWGIGYGNIKSEFIKRNFIGLSNAHNIFLGIIIDFGFLAFLLFFILIFQTFIYIKCALKKFKFTSNYKRILIIYSSAFFGFIINGCFHEDHINILFWILIICIAIFPRKIDINNHKEIIQKQQFKI